MRQEQLDVAVFHRTMEQPIELSPNSKPGEKWVRLRGRLVAEEGVEFLEGLFVRRSWFWCTVFTLLRALIAFIVARAPIGVRLAAVADAIADLKYVLEGSNLAFGIDGEPVWDEVHRKNMEKARGPMRADGKRLKPPGWTPPDIDAILSAQPPLNFDRRTEIDAKYLRRALAGFVYGGGFATEADVKHAREICERTKYLEKT